MVPREKEVPNMNMLMSDSPLGVAARRVALMPRETVKELIADLERRLERMRTCCSSIYDVDELLFAMHVSQTVELQGVVRGFGQDISAAMQVLDVLEGRFQEHKRAGLKGSPALRGAEITVLHDAIGLHRFQLSNLSAGEFGRAFRSTASRYRPSLLAGPARDTGGRRPMTAEALVAAFRKRGNASRRSTQFLKRVNTHRSGGQGPDA